MKHNLAEEVVMCKNSNAVKYDWSTLETSSLVPALKGNGDVRSSCFTSAIIREGSFNLHLF